MATGMWWRRKVNTKYHHSRYQMAVFSCCLERLLKQKQHEETEKRESTNHQWVLRERRHPRAIHHQEQKPRRKGTKTQNLASFRRAIDEQRRRRGENRVEAGKTEKKCFAWLSPS